MGKLDNVAKREDTKLHNVQSVLAKAVAGILVITEKLHTLALPVLPWLSQRTLVLTRVPCSTRPIKCWPLMLTSLPF